MTHISYLDAPRDLPNVINRPYQQKPIIIDGRHSCTSKDKGAALGTGTRRRASNAKKARRKGRISRRPSAPGAGLVIFIRPHNFHPVYTCHARATPRKSNPPPPPALLCIFSLPTPSFIDVYSVLKFLHPLHCA